MGISNCAEGFSKLNEGIFKVHMCAVLFEMFNAKEISKEALNKLVLEINEYQ